MWLMRRWLILLQWEWKKNIPVCERCNNEIEYDGKDGAVMKLKGIGNLLPPNRLV